MIIFLLLAQLLAQEPVFKTFVSSSPASFDPAHLYGTESSYIFHNIFRGLYKYDDKKGLVPEGAIKCSQSNKKLICDLNPKVKWSDGAVVEADDYVRAFRYLIDPNTNSMEIAALSKLKNASKILRGEVPSDKLGISAPSKFKLIFDFETEDPEFIYKLTSPVLIPWKLKPSLDQPEAVMTNGPYTVEKFIKEQKIILKPNPHYPFGNPKRPKVEFLFLTEDSTGQNLFDVGQINLQHRVDVNLIPKLKNSTGFYQKIFSRFDYIGFGPALMQNKDLRTAIVHALDYQELSRILHAAGRPGCVGLTKNFLQKEVCYSFDLKKAKKALEKVPQELKEKLYILKYSRAGGDNIARTMEWYHHQLKKHIGLKIQIESVEQGMYLQDLALNPPDLFRKGVNLDRPSCTSALEGFKTDSKDNYIRFKSLVFDKNLDMLSRIIDPISKKKKCTDLVETLMSENVIIPQGLIHYTMISDNKFIGWKFNELNQLDLSDLELNQKLKAPVGDKKQ